MTWSYSGDPSDSDLDAVRFYLGDVDSTTELMQDQEINYLLSTWMPLYDSTIYVASVAADILATRFVGSVDISADGVSVSLSDLSQRYADLAMRLRQTYEAADVGGDMDLSNLENCAWPAPGIKALNFGIGMTDNYMAGRQDFGGEFPLRGEDYVGAPGESGP